MVFQRFVSKSEFDAEKKRIALRNLKWKFKDWKKSYTVGFTGNGLKSFNFYTNPKSEYMILSIIREKNQNVLISVIG